MQPTIHNKNSTLTEKLLDFSKDLNSAERDNLKLILGEAAGGFAPHGKLPSDNLKGKAFQTVLSCLSKLQPHSSRLSDNYVAWRGRPDFMDDHLLSMLQNEAADRRKEALVEGGYLLGCGGPIVDKLSVSSTLLDFVTEKAGPVTATAVASYLYYEKPGQGLDPHVDTEVFSLNMILMLSHTYVADPSHLVLYPADKEPERILLKPGEMVLLYADSIVHAREAVKEGEKINLITIGFQPAMEEN